MCPARKFRWADGGARPPVRPRPAPPDGEKRGRGEGGGGRGKADARRAPRCVGAAWARDSAPQPDGPVDPLAPVGRKLVGQGRLGAPAVADLEPLAHVAGPVLAVNGPRPARRERVGLRSVGDEGRDHRCSWARLRAKAAWTRRTYSLKASGGSRASPGPAERSRAAYSASDMPAVPREASPRLRAGAP